MITYVGAASPASGSGIASLTLPRASSVDADLLLLVFGFEGVAPGSGPWVADTPGLTHVCTAEGYKRICYQDPSATGCGVEVWAATSNGSINPLAVFAGSQTVIAQMFAYRGEYAPMNIITDGAIRAAATKQVSGDNPDAPSVYTYFDEVVIVCAADKLQSPGYGAPTPTGWTKRDDQKRSAFGNVEITVADKYTAVEGATGAIPWAATAAAAGTKGATAALAVRSSLLLPGASSPLIAVEYAVAS